MSIVNIQALKQLGNVLWWTGQIASANAPKAITSVGDVKQILPFSGVGIGMFDGDGDYLVVSNGTDLNLGSNNFTVSAWVYPISVSQVGLIFGDQDGSGGDVRASWGIQIVNTTGVVRFFCLNSSGIISVDMSGTTNINGGWHHIEVCRSGSSWYLFVDGKQEATTTNTLTIRDHNTNARWLIGALSGSDGIMSNYFTGYISELRVKNGVCDHTAAFTPPRKQLESDSNTKLLIHFNRNDSTFIDSSPSAHAITAYGNATQLTSPCNSGIAYFDGNGDYLSCGSISNWNLGNSNWTFEFYVYLSSTAEQTLFSIPCSSIVSSLLVAYNGGYLTWGIGSSTTSWLVNATWTSAPISQNMWYYIVIERCSDGNIYGYVNGVKKYTYNIGNTAMVNASNNLKIGYFRATSPQYITGNIGEFRAYSNSKYNGVDFTPPTTPFKPDSYTKLLLHMDGVGNAFYDSSDPPGDNGFPILPDGVTVTPNGTFTTQKMKDGRNIWKFDGSTNYITISDHTSWSMFTNDFTIVGWVKFDSIAADRIIIGQYVDVGNCWYVKWTPTGNLVQLAGVTSSISKFDYACTLVPVVGTWYHIAVQRKDSNCLMFINSISQSVFQSMPFSTSVVDIAAALSIGKLGTEYQAGNTKDLQIFHKALTQDQIAAIMAETYIY